MANLTKPAKKSSVKKNDGEKKGKRPKVTEPVNTKESEERQKNKEKREKENAEKQKKMEQKEREKEKKEKERQALAERDNLYLEKLSHIASGSFWDGDDLYAADDIQELTDTMSLHENGTRDDSFPQNIVNQTMQIMSTVRPTTGGKKPRKEHRVQHITTTAQPNEPPKCQRCLQLEEQVRLLQRQLAECKKGSK